MPVGTSGLLANLTQATVAPSVAGPPPGPTPSWSATGPGTAGEDCADAGEWRHKTSRVSDPDGSAAGIRSSGLALSPRDPGKRPPEAIATSVPGSTGGERCGGCPAPLPSPG